MSPKETNDYTALEVEDDWIAYLRRRLPYSFMNVRKGRHAGRPCYILSDPRPNVGAEYHNFWRRGYAFYAAGKVLDTYSLSDFLVHYRHMVAERRRYVSKNAALHHLMRPLWEKDVYNAMELEKLWLPVRKNNLDRERVVMTNMCMAIEMCLKAVRTHVEYWDSGTFAFEFGHDVGEIYGSLPEPLRLSMEEESRKFAKHYAEFRKTIESELMARSLQPMEELDWEGIGARLEETAYTAILNMNDPYTEDDDWFAAAINVIGDIEYHRYSPDKGFDAYPVDPIHCGLMLGRFLYEHLFPVRRPEESEGLARFEHTGFGINIAWGGESCGSFL